MKLLCSNKTSWSCSLSKLDIRKKIGDKRRNINVSERQIAAQAATTQFISSPYFLSSTHFGCYLAQNSEFDCAPIIEEIWRQKKNCYLPILSSNNNNHLDFAHYNANDPLYPNRYNILEPKNAAIFPLKKLDIVLVPLVAFDLKGTRLGMGGGYYDRTFEFLLNTSRGKPFLLGLAFELQLVESLPSESFDVGLDGVLTEKRLVVFEKF